MAEQNIPSTTSLVPASQPQNIVLTPGSPVMLNIAMDESTFSVDGQNLVISVDNGQEIILQEYFSLAENGDIPYLEFADNVQVPGNAYLQYFEGEIDTAAGPGGGAGGAGGGAGEYSDDPGAINDGLGLIGGQGDPQVLYSASFNVGTDYNTLPIITSSATDLEIDETDGLGVVAAGSVSANFGNDVPGSYSLSAPNTSWQNNGDGIGTLTHNDGLWRIDLNTTNGSYTVTLLNPVNHPDTSDPDDIVQYSITATARDANGDTITSNFALLIRDDGPTITPQIILQGEIVGNGEIMEPRSDARNSMSDYPQPETSVDDVSFHHNGGLLTINVVQEAPGQDFNANGITNEFFDPEIHLYRLAEDGTLEPVSSNNNSPGSSNAQIIETFPEGNYILKVGSHDLTDDEARADLNLGGSPGPYQVHITGDITDVSSTTMSSPLNVVGDESNDFVVNEVTAEALGIDFGTDEEGQIELSMQLQESGGRSDWNAVTKTLTFFQDSQNPTGLEEAVWKIELTGNATDGYGYKFTQLQAINHDTPGDGIIPPNSHNENAHWDVTLTITDGDGDPVTATISIDIKDDGPSLTLDTNNAVEGLPIITLDETLGADRFSGDPIQNPGNDDDVAENPDILAQITTNVSSQSVSGLESLFTVGGDYGTDGLGTTVGNFTFQGVPKENGLETTLTATDGGTIRLFISEDGKTLTGKYTDDNGVADITAFTITISDIANNGHQLITTQYKAIDHGTDDNLFDSTQLLNLVGEQTLQLQYEVTRTDADTDTITTSKSITIASQEESIFAFEDDGPSLTLDTNNAVEGLPTITLDETLGVDRFNGDPNQASGNDDDVTGNLAILAQVTTNISSQSASGLESLFTVGGDYGTDGPGTTTGNFTFQGVPKESGRETTLTATDGGTIWLFASEDGKTLTGKYTDDNNVADITAFTITISNMGANGHQLITTLYKAMDHGSDGNLFDSTQLLNLVGEQTLQLQYEVTRTDADTDTITTSKSITIASQKESIFAFEDDGPTLTVGNNNTSEGLETITLDETLGADRYSVADTTQNPGNNDDVAGNSAILAQVTTDVSSQSVSGLESLFTVGGDYGADGPGTTLGNFTFQGVPKETGLETTLTATDGGTIRLFVSEDGKTLTGKYTDDNGVANITAFTIKISDMGINGHQFITTQHKAIDHGSDTNLFDGTQLLNLVGENALQLQYEVTRTDGDMDTVTASKAVTIASQKQSIFAFEDDGPSLTLDRNNDFEWLPTITLDETLGADRFNGDPNQTSGNDDDVTGNLAILAQVTTNISYQSVSGLESLFTIGGNYGTDGPGTTTGNFTFQGVPKENGLETTLTATDGGTIKLFVSEDGKTLTGKYTDDNGVADITAFTIKISDMGINGHQFITTQYKAIDHGSDTNLFDSTQLLNLVGEQTLQLQYDVTRTDADTDTITTSKSITIASQKESIFAFEDDGPTITNIAATITATTDSDFIEVDLIDLPDGSGESPATFVSNGLTFTALAPNGAPASFIDAGSGLGIKSSQDGGHGRFNEVNFFPAAGGKPAGSEQFVVDLPDGKLAFSLDINFAAFFSNSENEKLQVEFLRDGTSVSSTTITSTETSGNVDGSFSVPITEGYDQIQITAVDDGDAGDNSDFAISGLKVGLVPTGTIGHESGVLNGDFGSDGPGRYALLDSADEVVANGLLVVDGKYEVYLDDAGNWNIYQYTGIDGPIEIKHRIYDGDGDYKDAVITVDPIDQALLVVGTDNNDDIGSQTPFEIGAKFSGQDITDDGEDADSTFGHIDGGSNADILVGDSSGSDLQSNHYHYAFITDTSGSINNTEMGNIKTALINSLTFLHEKAASTDTTITVRVSDFDTIENGFKIITFDKDGGITGDYTALSGINTWINAMQNGGLTNYESGLINATTWFTGINNPAYSNAIFFTDGRPNYYYKGEDTSGTPVAGTFPTNLQQLLGTYTGNPADKVNDITSLHAVTNTVTSVALGVDTNTGVSGTIDTPQDLLDYISKGADTINLTDSSKILTAFKNIINATLLNAVGDDAISGNEGDDIIFGDTLFTDTISVDLLKSDETITPGDGWANIAKLADKNTNGSSLDEIRSYIQDNHQTLAQESTSGDKAREGGDDTIDGGSGNDIIYGQEGIDIINGGTGADILNGGTGTDTLNGGIGNDILFGGKDSVQDTLTGGDGADIFIAGSGDTLDLIDTDNAQDVIYIDSSMLQSDQNASPVTIENFVITEDKLQLGTGLDLINISVDTTNNTATIKDGENTLVLKFEPTPNLDMDNLLIDPIESAHIQQIIASSQG